MTPELYDALLKPVASNRIANLTKAGRKFAYLEQWDIRAHLIRYFGFGGWSADLIETELAYEEQDDKKKWVVGYRAVLRLTLHGFGPNGVDVTYTEAAVGSSQGGSSRPDAHDNAIKTAASEALKRCAINLGTVFGLSLYNQGSRADVIGFTYHEPPGWEGERAVPAEPIVVPPPSAEVRASVASATTREALRALWDACLTEGNLESPFDEDGLTMRELIVERLAEVDSE